jgi:hypothetical protein
MNVPERLREADRKEAVIREYEDDHTTAIAADFGPEAGDISTDIVGCTAIVVVGDDQFEFELPDDVREITTNNGVLTIEG